MFLVAPLIIWKYQQAKARAWVTGADAWVTGLWLCGSILRIINSSRPAVTPAGSQPVPNMMRELVPNEAATHASLQCEVILMNLKAAKHKNQCRLRGPGGPPETLASDWRILESMSRVQIVRSRQQWATPLPQLLPRFLMDCWVFLHVWISGNRNFASRF